MAIAALGTDAQTTEQVNDTSVSVSHTLAAGGDRIVLVKVTAWDDAAVPTISSVTYGGVAATEVVASTLTGFYRTAIYAVKEADLPTNGANSAVVTYSTSVNEKALVVCARSGVDQTTTWRDTDSTSASSGTHPTLTLTTDAGDWVETALGQFNGTPTSDDTLDTSAQGAADATDCFASHRVASGTSTAVGWTITSNDHLLVAATLIAKAAGGGGGATQPPRTMHQARLRRAA